MWFEVEQVAQSTVEIHHPDPEGWKKILELLGD